MRKLNLMRAGLAAMLAVAPFTAAAMTPILAEEVSRVPESVFDLTGPGGQGSISIRKPAYAAAPVFPEKTAIKVYDILELTDTGYEANETFRTWLEEMLKTDDPADAISKMSAADLQKFVTSLAAEAKGKTPMVEGTLTQAATVISVKDLPLGMYLVFDGTSMPALASLDKEEPSATITSKGAELRSMKKVYEDDMLKVLQDQNPGQDMSDYGSNDSSPDLSDPKTGKQFEGFNDIADAAIGQKVPFNLFATLPDHDELKNCDKMVFTFHDVMDPGLVLDKDSFVIRMNAANGQAFDLSFADCKLTGTEDGFDLELPDLAPIYQEKFKDHDPDIFSAWRTIDVFFEATLEDSALVTGRPGIENTSWVTWNNGIGEYSTSKDTTVIFTYRIDGLKTDQEKQPVEGAEFELFRDAEGKEPIKVRRAEGETSTYVLDPNGTAVITSGRDGQFDIVGLDQGSYWIRESKVPEGYTGSTQMVKVNLDPEFPSYEDRQFRAGKGGSTLDSGYKPGEGATDKILKDLTGTVDDKPAKTDVETGSLELEVTNTKDEKPIPELPHAGDWMMAGLAVAGTGAMIVAIKGRKKIEE